MMEPVDTARRASSLSVEDVREAVERALQRIEDPCSVSMKAGWSVFDLGLLEDVHTTDGEVVVEIVLTDPFCPFFETLDDLIATAVAEETGSRVRVEVSGEGWHPGRAKKGLLMSKGVDAPP
jgi:metal-sulfur cluster biosynthetic enzyme